MKQRLTPLYLSLAVVVGILIGAYVSAPRQGGKLSLMNVGSDKLTYLLRLVEDKYVDTVNLPQIVEGAMPQILSQLDPHSRYIPAADIEQENEPLHGSFGGIGISFTMQRDTVNVMSLIPSGPAQKVGIMPGDRIVMADTTSLVGMKDTQVMKHLKGETQTSVALTVVRRGHSEPLHFTVQRAQIPLVSVDASYMMPDHTGYLRIKNFGEHTYSEVMVALAKFNVQGMRSLIIDLRGNSGGYMHVPIQIANEFLPKGRLIVYTEGRKTRREDFRSDGYGSFQTLPLAILIDEGSASSSEILAGAIQDNDRGTLVGRRSFGKGLVQQPIDFPDGSSVRLTIARYYTPSGRCIQKPYEPGKGEDYDNDLLARYERGEFFSLDSIPQAGPTYLTHGGRTVRGGGGIMPDIFVPEDTTALTSYYKQALIGGHLREFAFTYADTHRHLLAEYHTTESLARHLRSQRLTDQFVPFAEQRGLKRRNLMIQKSRPLIERNLVATIIFNVRDVADYVQYLNLDDPTVLRARQALQCGEEAQK